MYSSNSTTISSASSNQTKPIRSSAATGSSGWYVGVAKVWGAALDRQAEETIDKAKSLNDGNDSPGAALQVSAAAHQLAFLSTAANTASNSIGQALETLGKKQ
jgi:hypothetical protein